MKNTNKFAERLQEARKDKNLTQTALAKALGFAQSTISGWEQGVREPCFDDLIKICDFLEVSADYLLGRKEYYED